MNSSNFLNVIEYILLPHLENYLYIHENQFAYRPATGCMDAKTVLNKTVMYYHLQRSDVYCAMVDLSKAYDRINTSVLFDKMKETELPGQVIALINFMCKDTFFRTSYGGQLSDEWKARIGVRQGGISSGKFFNFYLNEVISDISKLLAGCTLTCGKVNILGYADDLVLVAPTAQALQLMLEALTSKLSTLSLQANMQKSCNTVFRHSNKKVLTILTMNNQPLR